MVITYTDGSKEALCPSHARDVIPTADRPPWYGRSDAGLLPDGVASIALWPEEE